MNKFNLVNLYLLLQRYLCVLTFISDSHCLYSLLKIPIFFLCFSFVHIQLQKTPNVRRFFLCFLLLLYFICQQRFVMLLLQMHREESIFAMYKLTSQKAYNNFGWGRGMWWVVSWRRNKWKIIGGCENFRIFNTSKRIFTEWKVHKFA